MEIYDGPYFRVNKLLLTKGGLWPYEKNLMKKIISRLYIGLPIFIVSLPQFYGLHENFGVRADMIIEHLTLLMFMYGIFLKFITTILAENNLKKVYDSIVENWLNLEDTYERGILSNYSEYGAKLTKVYLVYMMAAGSFYIILPLTPLILNIADQSNMTHRPDFIFNGAFPLDNPRDHYLQIFAFDTIGCYANLYVLVTVDGMYACCVQHCTGLFAIVRHRLQLCTSYTDERSKDVAYELIVKIVQLHRKTIAFTDLLENSYSMSFLVLMGMNMLHCTCVSVLLLLRRHEPMELVRYGGALGGLLIHIFFISWLGQKLIDHSTDLFDDAYTNDWYKISRKSQHLLRFMKMRCLKPCQLTAGGIYIMNLANFAQIIKTSGSYITVFASFT